jgi:hypothetical protein
MPGPHLGLRVTERTSDRILGVARPTPLPPKSLRPMWRGAAARVVPRGIADPLVQCATTALAVRQPD